MLRVAILGAGIGGEHLQAYLSMPDLYQVRLICDLDQQRAKPLAKRCEARLAASWRVALDDEEIDLIDICLPPKLHFEVAQAALQADKHVLLEKPMAGSLSQAQALVEIAKRAQGHLFPVFQYRYGPSMSALFRLKAAGYLSRPQVASIETHWNRDEAYYANPWRGTWDYELGGAILSHAIHAHDLLSLVFGPVAAVSAFLTTRINAIETED